MPSDCSNGKEVKDIIQSKVVKGGGLDGEEGVIQKHTTGLARASLLSQKKWIIQSREKAQVGPSMGNSQDQLICRLKATSRPIRKHISYECAAYAWLSSKVVWIHLGAY